MAETIETTIRDTIKAGREASLAFVDTDAAKTVHKGDEPKERLAVVPYTIVKCLSSLDNIYETRLFGWTLAKAQSVLKLYNKDLSEINVEHALGLTRVTVPTRLIIGDETNNYDVVKKAFTLAEKKIEYDRDGVHYHLNIIAFPELRKEGRRSMVSYVIHNELWHALLDFSRGYRLFRLDVYMALSSKYAVIMYLLISQQSGPKKYTIETLRQLLNCDKQRAYDRGANFFARVIDPARAELMLKAPWYYEYTANKEGKRHQYTEIIITPVLNKIALEPTAATIQAASMRLRLEQRVTDYLTYNYGMAPREIETIEAMVIRLGDVDKQLGTLEAIRHRCLAGRVKNHAGYLVRTLQNITKQAG